MWVICFHVVRRLRYVWFFTCSILELNCVLHFRILNTINLGYYFDCYTAHPSIDFCRNYDLGWINYHPAPPILAQPCGWSNRCHSSCPWHKKNPLKKQRFNRDNVSSKPTYAGWVAYSPHCAHARTSTHNSNLGVQHVKETNSTKMVHMLHMLWFVANNYCNVLGTHWRLSAQCVHGYQVWIHESPSIRTSIILRWREVWLKWCSTHPRIIGTWQ